MKAFASLALLTSLGSAAFAQSYITTGSLTTSDTRFARPTSLTAVSTSTTAGNAVAYDVFAFTVGQTGNYTAELNSPDTLDTYLLIYGGAFTPTTPLTNLINGDDDFAGTFTVLPGLQSASTRATQITVAGGGNYATTGLPLVTGTTYYAVVTSFYNATNANGNGVGTYSLGLGGPGAVTPVSSVPEPATMAALGLGAVALLKRRRKS